MISLLQSVSKVLNASSYGVLLLLIIVFYVFRVTLVETRVIAAVSASILRSEIISGAKRENDGEDEEDDEEGGER